MLIRIQIICHWLLLNCTLLFCCQIIAETRKEQELIQFTALRSSSAAVQVELVHERLEVGVK